jgi:hypothetical protein
MDLRTVLAALSGAGATANARRSLDQWARAQDEVAARLDRMAARDPVPSPQVSAAATHPAA